MTAQDVWRALWSGPPATVAELAGRLGEDPGIIRKRVDALGVAEPEVSRQGNTIIVQLPGATDQQQVLGVDADGAGRPGRRVALVDAVGVVAAALQPAAVRRGQVDDREIAEIADLVDPRLDQHLARVGIGRGEIHAHLLGPDDERAGRHVGRGALHR